MHTSIKSLFIELSHRFLVYIKCVQPNFTNTQFKLCLFFCKKEGVWVKHGVFLKAFHVPIAFLHKVLKVEIERREGRAEVHRGPHPGSD